VRNGQCFCPKGTERKQTGTYAYECVKPPPPITCKGGSVKDGVCYCPKGTARKQTGKYAYACEKTAPPPTQSGPSTTLPELKIDPKLLKKIPRLQ